MRTMTCLIGAEHDIAVHLCNFIKDSRGSSRVLPYHAQKKVTGSAQPSRLSPPSQPSQPAPKVPHQLPTQKPIRNQ